MTDKVIIDCTTGEIKEATFTQKERDRRSSDASEAETRQAVEKQAAEEDRKRLDALKQRLDLTDEDIAALRGRRP